MTIAFAFGRHGIALTPTHTIRCDYGRRRYGFRITTHHHHLELVVPPSRGGTHRYLDVG